MLRLVLTAPPSDRERFLLSTIRLSPHAIADKGDGSKMEQEFLYIDGQLVEQAKEPLVGLRSPILKRLGLAPATTQTTNDE